MIVAGVMSGTSADGVDVAVVSIQGRGSYLSFNLLLHDHTEYPHAIRKAVLAAMNASKISVAELSRLNFRLGEFYAEAVSKAQKKSGQAKLDLVGCHGQTIYHQGTSAPYLGKKYCMHVADRRRIRGRGETWSAGGVGFSTGRHGRRRQRRATCSIA